MSASPLVSTESTLGKESTPEVSPEARIWFHIDINAYFATLVQQEVPSLRGKPIGIVKDIGRTCVIAASKEAKLKGVRTGEYWADAQAKCPDLIPFPANFDFAWSATRQLHHLLNSLSPDVEVFSLDEVFLDFTPLHNLYSSPRAFAELIQTQIKATLGEWVTCNIGIAPTRLLAKMTSEVSPKGSITQITEENTYALLGSTPFAAVCGVGMRLEAKLARFGVTTPLQIAFLPDEELAAVVGPFWVTELKKISRGEDPLFLTRIDQNPHAKSVGRSLTGYKLWRSRKEVEAVLYNLATEVIHKLRSMQLSGRLVWVSLRGSSQMGKSIGGRASEFHQTEAHDDFQTNRYDKHPNRYDKHATLTQPLCHLGEFFQTIQYMLHDWDFFPVIKCGVGLGLCQPADYTPLPLFTDWWKHERLHQAMDAINHKYGLYTLRSGVLLNQPIVKPEVTGFFGDRQYQMMKG